MTVQFLYKKLEKLLQLKNTVPKNVKGGHAVA
jgi:hypothetical protein